MLFEQDTNRSIIFALSGLTVTYTRYHIQYQEPPWADGAISFLALWFVHCLLIMMVSAFVWLINKRIERFVFNATDGSVDDFGLIRLNVSIVLFIASLLCLIGHRGQV
jgi:hypothetical protein